MKLSHLKPVRTALQPILENIKIEISSNNNNDTTSGNNNKKRKQRDNDKLAEMDRKYINQVRKQINIFFSSFIE